MCACSLFLSICADCVIPIHTRSATTSQSSPPAAAPPRTTPSPASRAGQLAIHHRCLQSGWWREGEGEKRRRGTGGECVKGVRKKREVKKRRGGGDRSKQGEEDSGDKQVFLYWLATSFPVCVCVIASVCLLVLNQCRTRYTEEDYESPPL